MSLISQLTSLKWENVHLFHIFPLAPLLEKCIFKTSGPGNQPLVIFGKSSDFSPKTVTTPLARGLFRPLRRLTATPLWPHSIHVDGPIGWVLAGGWKWALLQGAVNIKAEYIVLLLIFLWIFYCVKLPHCRLGWKIEISKCVAAIFWGNFNYPIQTLEPQ